MCVRRDHDAVDVGGHGARVSIGAVEVSKDREIVESETAIGDKG